uniref:G protein subunit alpha 13 n=1 Tax=Ovis aries TaxID=9940 RepID=A0AC11EAW3_SHEEP
MADFLPSRSVLSVCFPGCVLTSGEAEQQRKSKEIDKCLSREKTYVKRLVKILLLGAGESGKSTFLKQMRIIHGQDFDQRAREEFRPTIYSNVIKDLLEEKVQIVSIKDYFLEFEGDPHCLRDVQKFLVECFRSKRRDQQQKPLYHHFTTAINTENIRLVFRDVKDTILHDNLKQLMLQ